MERCRQLFISSSVATLCTRLRQQRSKLIVLISKSASLATTLKLFFAAQHCIPARLCQLLWCLFQFIKDPWGLHNQAMFGVFHFIPSNEPSLHRTLFLSRKSMNWIGHVFGHSVRVADQLNLVKWKEAALYSKIIQIKTLQKENLNLKEEIKF